MPASPEKRFLISLALSGGNDQVLEGPSRPAGETVAVMPRIHHKREHAPGIEEWMGKAFVENVARGDVPSNLSATSLMANAFMCSGKEKYRAWVKEYTEAQMERARENGGSFRTTSVSPAKSASTSSASGMAAITAGLGRTAGTP